MTIEREAPYRSTRRLCDCDEPLRDRDSPELRFWCKHCGGAAPAGRRVSRAEAVRLIDQAASLLARLRADLRLVDESTYGLRAPGEHIGSRPSGHGDPTAAVGGGRRSEAAVWACLSGQWLKQGLAWMVNADEAAGFALTSTDPHHGPVDHVKAAYHDRIDVPAGRPDLQAAWDAKARRQERGEL